MAIVNSGARAFSTFGHLIRGNRQRAMLASAAIFAAATSASGQIYVPIILNNSSFDVDIVVEKGSLVNTRAKVTASMDNGTANPGNNTWFEQGFDASNPTHGLPPSAAVFTSQNDSNHQFKMQSYGPVAGDTGTTHNNALLLGDTGVTGNTLTLSNPQPYSAMSVLAASGNGTGTYTVTVDYANGAPSSVITGVQTPDWFSGGVVAWTAGGRVVPNTGTASPQNNGTNPKLYQEDFNVPDSVDPVADIKFSAFTSSGGGRTAIFAVSGVATAASTTITYTGTAASPNAGIFDTTSLNFKNGGGTATAFVTGNLVIFDDSATGTHNVTVASGGVQPSTITFNNTTGTAPYVFSGGPIAGGATIAFNGNGQTTFNNANSYLGDTDVNGGTFVIGSTGSVASSNIVIGSGATFIILAGGQTTSTFSVIDNGTANFNNPARTLTSLQGNGQVNLNGTALTAGSGSNFSGTFGGTGGSLNLTGGSLVVSSQSQISSLTGITVGSTATFNISNSTTIGSASTPLTLAALGTLTTSDNVNAIYNGPILVTGSATITAGATDLGSSSLTLNGVISGTGPINFATTGQASATTPQIILNAANTYTGETDFGGSGSSFDFGVIQIGVNNGISLSSGFSFTSTATFGLTVDLNGHNQSVTYLTGGTSASNVITTSTGSSVLTISNGNIGTVNSVFGATISGAVSVTKTGAGNQIFIGTNNSYTGPTTIAGGTLTASVPTAFASSPITLAGGALGLATQTAGATRISGFGNFVETTNTGVNSNGGAGTYSSTALTLTTGINSQANAAFTSAAQTINPAGFVANFTYNTTGGADGVAFVIQNDPRGNAAVGGAGGGLGYGSNNNGIAISNSLALEINIYNGYGIGTSVQTNGNIPATYPPATGITLADGTNKVVTVVYSAATQTVTETITGNGTYTNTFFGINLASLLGGNSGYVGFTGATGGVSSTQTISNFTFSDLANVPVSITNAVTATAGTTSGITFPVTPTAASASIGSLSIPATAGVAINTINTAGNAGSGVLIVPSFSVSGTLDVVTNAVDIQGSSLASITALAKSGLNIGGTPFGGTGITSSAAAASTSHTTAVGVIVNNVNGTQLYGTATPLGMFDGPGGANPGSSDVLVKYTYFGDANLDGKVDGSDYSLIDNGYAVNKATPGTLTGWYNGDFNYDGLVNGSDYTLIDNAFNQQGSVLNANLDAQVAAQVGGSAVPEPATLSVIGLAAVGLLGRRRR